jgi:hypothetical protein
MYYDGDLTLILERMAADSAIRRELLWLRAKEKEDEETARELEELEPGLRERMAELVRDLAKRRRGSRSEATHTSSKPGARTGAREFAFHSPHELWSCDWLPAADRQS